MLCEDAEKPGAGRAFRGVKAEKPGAALLASPNPFARLLEPHPIVFSENPLKIPEEVVDY